MFFEVKSSSICFPVYAIVFIKKAFLEKIKKVNRLQQRVFMIDSIDSCSVNSDILLLSINMKFTFSLLLFNFHWLI